MGCLGRLVAVVVVGIAAFTAGWHYGAERGPTCHSLTEDSTIFDCDFRGGGWYPDP